MDSKIIKYILIIFLFSFKVSAVEFKGKFIQGHFIIGKTDPNSKVKIGKREVKISKDGYFVFGIGRDRKYDLVITLEKNGIKKKITKRIQKRKYNIQRIDGLEEKRRKNLIIYGDNLPKINQKEISMKLIKIKKKI